LFALRGVRLKIGVCGIACEVCGLYKKNICKGCVIEPENPCPIPGCAKEKGIEFCSDCDEFPCKIYHKAEYPYSVSYLSMHHERMKSSKK